MDVEARALLAVYKFAHGTMEARRGGRDPDRVINFLYVFHNDCHIPWRSAWLSLAGGSFGPVAGWDQGAAVFFLLQRHPPAANLLFQWQTLHL